MKTYQEFMESFSEGKLFKDKFGDLHIVAGGSKVVPNAISFDPQRGSVNSFGTFGNSITSGDWKLVEKPKKSDIKKFIKSIEHELLLAKDGERSLLDDGAGGLFSGKEAIKFLKRF